MAALGHETVVMLVERIPIAAVDHDQDRRSGMLRREDVQCLYGKIAVRDVPAPLAALRGVSALQASQRSK